MLCIFIIITVIIMIEKSLSIIVGKDPIVSFYRRSIYHYNYNGLQLHETPRSHRRYVQQSRALLRAANPRGAAWPRPTQCPPEGPCLPLRSPPREVGRFVQPGTLLPARPQDLPDGARRYASLLTLQPKQRAHGVQDSGAWGLCPRKQWTNVEANATCLQLWCPTQKSIKR